MASSVIVPQAIMDMNANIWWTIVPLGHAETMEHAIIVVPPTNANVIWALREHIVNIMWTNAKHKCFVTEQGRKGKERKILNTVVLILEAPLFFNFKMF